MSLLQVGRMCLKVAGRDAGKRCVILAREGNLALIDGETRRRKVNVVHLEPMSDVVDIKENANHSDVAKVLGPLGITVRETKPKTPAKRPTQQRKVNEKSVKKVRASTKPKATKAVEKEVKAESAQPKTEQKVEKPVEVKETKPATETKPEIKKE
jgi:large subunit ribosomal protein L14e